MLTRSSPHAYARPPRADPPRAALDRRWLGKKGGTVQFLALDDAFVFTKVDPPKSQQDQPTLSSWTATRKGAPRAAAKAKEGKRSLLSKYGWYLLIAFGYVGYKAVQEQAQKLK